MDPDQEFFPPLTAAGARCQLAELCHRLKEFGSLIIRPNKHGVYAASSSQRDDSESGYQDAWLRDNVMVAFSCWKGGDASAAMETLRGLQKFLITQIPRMEAIIRSPKLKHDTQARPHVRFKATTLTEIERGWSHAQNDALAYVVWLRFLLANQEPDFGLDASEADLFRVFPRYFEKIKYWEDRDSGAWEESEKVNSSSVGAVVAALVEMQRFGTQKRKSLRMPEQYFQLLIDRGISTLKKQLPFEAPPFRRTDAALLFLIYPLKLLGTHGLITDATTEHFVLSLVEARLVGVRGIKRYVGDSYYCQDYDKWFPPEMRSGDFSKSVEFRDEFLQPGCEAQWCLFDPLLSVIYGEKRRSSQQLHYINRAIAQITPAGACPELYYLKSGKYEPNEHTPLAWTQANLALALNCIRKSLDGS